MECMKHESRVEVLVFESEKVWGDDRTVGR